MDRLSLRMEHIVSMVPKGSRITDVGCDHGYVSIALVNRGIAPFAICMDINKGPLERAREHVLEAGLSEKISLRLSNGLDAYLKGESDTIVIAGMGGPLIIDILKKGYDKITGEDAPYLILSPQSEIAKTRISLSEMGFKIFDEDMIREDGKFYVIMKVKHIGEANGVGTGFDWKSASLGEVLINQRHPVLKEYINFEIEKNDKIIKKLKGEVQTPLIDAKINECEENLKLLKEVLWQN